jgi:adenosylcobinamide-GDP ribazoletransferase
MTENPGSAARTTAADALRLAFGMLSVLPVRFPRVDRRVAGRAMAAAPLVGVVLAGIAAGVQGAARWAGTGTLLAAVLALGALALLTRGLHLDGLADVADGLGSGKPAPDALRIMKASDIGPFGVLALVFTLLVQAAALARAAGPGPGEAAAALVIAVVAGRTAIGIGCLRGVPSARPDGLGAMVAGTLSPPAAAVTVAVLTAGAAGLGAATSIGALRAALAAVLASAAATALLRHCVRRFGGITGDVLGAMAETAAATALVVLSTG